MVFVLIDREEDKAAVKRYLDKVGVVSQFLLAKNMLDKKKSWPSILGKVLAQVNAKLNGVNW